MTVVDTTTMWDGQRGFRSLAQADAREVFGAVDARLRPTVALVGLRAEPGADQAAACIEPERYQHALASLATAHDALLAVGGDDAGQPAFDARRTSGQLMRAHHLAARQAIEQHLPALEAGGATITRCSLPHRVGSFDVFVVVQFDRLIYERHAADPAARADETRGEDGGTAYREAPDEARSATAAAPGAVDSAAADGAAADGAAVETLVDAVAEAFLDACATSLSRPDRGRFGVLEHEIPDLLRAGGRRLMHTVGRHMHGMLDLYDICNVISTMRYEGADGVGSLLIAPQPRPDVHLQLTLRQPVSLRDYRKVRKLLEISDGELQLVCADGDVIGFGRQAAEATVAPRYRIEFVGHHRWRATRGARVLMEVSYGQPHLPTPRLDPDTFRARVARAFPTMDAPALEALWTLVAAASEQHHGTMVVVSAGAEGEAARLGTQATPTEPTAMTPELMRLITAIDGAVLLDTGNRCHAIGVILDGRSTDAGDPARGARYNSAVRYVASSAHPCLAIVVSEDGMIDVVGSAT